MKLGEQHNVKQQIYDIWTEVDKAKTLKDNIINTEPYNLLRTKLSHFWLLYEIRQIQAKKLNINTTELFI